MTQDDNNLFTIFGDSNFNMAFAAVEDLFLIGVFRHSNFDEIVP